MFRQANTDLGPCPDGSGGEGPSSRSRPIRRPVLIVLHQPHSNPGHVGRWFTDNGFPLDVRRPRFGDRLPETLAQHTGAVVFGGPMSANDTDDFMRYEIEWLSVPLSEEKPFMGICLGAQMLSLFLGGEVRVDPDGHSEIGYHEIHPTEQGRTLFDWPERVYQWHKEGFTLPKGATLLARGTRFERQAFQFGKAAFGVQFHPEISHVMVNKWSTRSAHRLVLPGAKPREEHIDGHVRFGPGQMRWLSDFLTRWTRIGAVSD